MLRSSKDDLSSSVLSHVSSNAGPLCWPSLVLLPFAVVSALRDDSACAEEAMMLLSSGSSASISRSARLCLRLRLLGAGCDSTVSPHCKLPRSRQRYFPRSKSLTPIFIFSFHFA